MDRSISETARWNHEKLWPGYRSRFTETSPELMVVFDNFAFDEVLRENKMETKAEIKVNMASTVGSQSLTEYEIMLHAALNIGVKPVEIKEAIYHSQSRKVSRLFKHDK